ncbi:hypothetical protein [Bacillus sp. FJAT-45350]|uniref:hypothetical protein n=1 Tax=Bacillus sp. FJAT-45350 TaxID=2011014 RepID=UPI00359C4BC6
MVDTNNKLIGIITVKELLKVVAIINVFIKEKRHQEVIFLTLFQEIQLRKF